MDRARTPHILLGDLISALGIPRPPPWSPTVALPKTDRAGTFSRPLPLFRATTSYRIQVDPDTHGDCIR